VGYFDDIPDVSSAGVAAAPAAAPPDYFGDIPANPVVAYGQQQGLSDDDIKKLVADAPQWSKNAMSALAETVQGFVPQSLSDVANFLTPVAGLPAEAKQVYASAHRLIAGGTVDQAVKEAYP
jgi:hypothetical protein